MRSATPSCGAGGRGTASRPTHLNAPIVGVSVDPATSGYWEVVADGGVVAYGTRYSASMAGHPLTAPVVSIAEA
jgi:hypothetical protein